MGYDLVNCTSATSTGTLYRGNGHGQPACSLPRPRTPSTMSVPACTSTSLSHLISVRADPYGG